MLDEYDDIVGAMDTGEWKTEAEHLSISGGTNMNTNSRYNSYRYFCYDYLGYAVFGAGDKWW